MADQNFFSIPYLILEFETDDRYGSEYIRRRKLYIDIIVTTPQNDFTITYNGRIYTDFWPIFDIGIWNLW